MTESDSTEERRVSPRRWVMLRVQLKDASNVVLSQTINVSDTGILIERPEGQQLETGQLVSAVVEGLLPAEGEAGAPRPMVVVRAGEQVALGFMDL
jgi:hypothetical protein